MNVKKRKLALADFQQWMQQMLLDASGQIRIDGKEVELLPVEEVIKPSERLAAWQHLAIYQHGYTARLRDCMAKQFTALEYALGKQLFQAFADEYLHQYPSESYNLANLGDRFSTFLQETRPDREEQVKEEWPDFMIELAQFECAINRIFDEEINEEYTLVTADETTEKLKLIPGIHLFKFKFPVRWYYSEVANDRAPDLPAAEETYCVVFRQDYKLLMFDLHLEQYLLLLQLQGERTLPEALQVLSNQYGVSYASLEKAWPEWRKQWLKHGFFCKA